MVAARQLSGQAARTQRADSSTGILPVGPVGVSPAEYAKGRIRLAAPNRRQIPSCAFARILRSCRSSVRKSQFSFSSIQEIRRSPFEFQRSGFSPKLSCANCLLAHSQLIRAEFWSLLRDLTRLVQRCDGAPV